VALQDVLSAVRQVILDDAGMVPEEQSSRRVYFKNRFPTLSSEELEDLAKIPSDRFAIYTGTIFRGEARVLKEHFPRSCVLIEKLEKRGEEGRFSLDAFIRQVHQSYPWRSYETEDLAKSFTEYITTKRGDLIEKAPILAELLQLEFSTLKLQFTKHTGVVAEKHLSISSILQWPVAQLIDSNFIVSPITRFDRFKYDVMARKSLALSAAKESPQFVIGSQSDNFEVHWTPLPEPVYSYLSKLKPNVHQSVEEFAEVFVSSLPPGSEEEQFSALLDLLLKLVSAGAIRLV